MSENRIGGPQSPKGLGWDDDGSDDASLHPDASFADDAVGARTAARNAARAKQLLDKAAVQPRRIATESQKINKAAPFKPAAEDSLARESMRKSIARAPAKQIVSGKASNKGVHATLSTSEHDVARLEGRVQLLMARLNLLAAGNSFSKAEVPTVLEKEDALECVASDDDVLDAADNLEPIGDGNKKHQQPSQHNDDDDDVDTQDTERDDVTSGLQQRFHIERETKFALQHLLTSGLGFSLLQEPQSTFKRLFDGIDAWPQTVRPGKRPQTPQEFDAFLAWVFEPVASPELFAAAAEAIAGL